MASRLRHLGLIVAMFFVGLLFSHGASAVLGNALSVENGVNIEYAPGYIIPWPSGSYGSCYVAFNGTNCLNTGLSSSPVGGGGARYPNQPKPNDNFELGILVIASAGLLMLMYSSRKKGKGHL